MWLVTRPCYFVAGNVNPVNGWPQVSKVSCRGVNKAWDHSGRHKAVLVPVAEHTARYPFSTPNKPQPKKDMSSLLKYIYCTNK